MNWPFADPPNVAVFTSKQIVEDGYCIYYVCHDAEDGVWQFHSMDGAPESTSDARIFSLKTILEMDSSIALLADLPLGWCAWRSFKESEWQRGPKS